MIQIKNRKSSRKYNESIKNALNSDYPTVRNGRIVFRTVPYVLRNHINLAINRTVHSQLKSSESKVLHFIFDRTHGWTDEGAVISTDHIKNGVSNCNGLGLSGKTIRNSLKVLQDLGIIYRGYRKGFWFIWVNLSFNPVRSGFILEGSSVWGAKYHKEMFWEDKHKALGVADYESNNRAVALLSDIGLGETDDFMKLAKLHGSLEKRQAKIRKDALERENKEMRSLIGQQDKIIRGAEMLPKLKSGVSRVAEVDSIFSLEEAISSATVGIQTRRDESTAEKKSKNTRANINERERQKYIDTVKDINPVNTPEKQARVTMRELEDSWYNGINDRFNKEDSLVENSYIITKWGGKEFGQMKGIYTRGNIPMDKRQEFVYYVANNWADIMNEYFKWVDIQTMRHPNLGFVLRMIDVFVTAYNYRPSDLRAEPAELYVIEGSSGIFNKDKSKDINVFEVFTNLFKSPEKIDLKSPVFMKMPPKYRIALEEARLNYEDYCSKNNMDVVVPDRRSEKTDKVNEVSVSGIPNKEELIYFAGIVKNPLGLNPSSPIYLGLSLDYKTIISTSIFDFLMANPKKVKSALPQMSVLSQEDKAEINLVRDGYLRSQQHKDDLAQEAKDKTQRASDELNEMIKNTSDAKREKDNRFAIEWEEGLADRLEAQKKARAETLFQENEKNGLLEETGEEKRIREKLIEQEDERKEYIKKQLEAYDNVDREELMAEAKKKNILYKKKEEEKRKKKEEEYAQTARMLFGDDYVMPE